jgi:hypothetical protein
MREQLPRQFPGASVAFLPADMVSQILNFGVPAPVDLQVVGNDLQADRKFTNELRANFSSADLARRDFSGLNLRGIKMDRAVLRGADFTGAHLQNANLIGAILQEACFDRADLSRAHLSGGEPRLGQFRERLPRQGRDGVRIDGPTQCCKAPASVKLT